MNKFFRRYVLTRVNKGGDAAEEKIMAASDVLFDVCSTDKPKLGEEKHVQDI